MAGVDGGRAGFSALVFSDLRRYRPIERPTWFHVITRLATLPGLLASVIVRAQQCLFEAGHLRAAQGLQTLGVVIAGIDVTAGASIGEGLFMPHPQGIVIGNGAVLGHGVTLAQGVTIGAREMDPTARQSFPIIGDGAMLLTHAVVIGGVRVGRGATVGANAVVLGDVPEGATVGGIPARVLGARRTETTPRTGESGSR